MVPDLDQARKFLRVLDPKAEGFVFQTFDDDADRSDTALARVIASTLDECAGQLAELNRRGAGVFVTVNRSKNGGRKKGDISAYRAIWREADAPNLPPLPLAPHMVVETSPGRHHEYLFINDADPARGDAIMRGMVERYGSDPNAKDRTRVLRLPGFYHRKGDPHLVRIVEYRDSQRYTLDEVAAHIPPAREEQQATPSQMHTANTPYGTKALAEELAALCAAPEGNRNATLNRAAFSLGQLVAGGELERGMVEPALMAAAASIGLPAAEVQATVRSGLESGLKQPRAAMEQPQDSNEPKRDDCVKLVCAADIRPEPIDWLWPGHIASGKIHILAGPAGHGKTTITHALTATITVGGRWPDGSKAPLGDVAIWSGEDDPADTIIPRLLACGADLRRVHIIGGVIENGNRRAFDPARDIEILRRTLTDRPVKMLVVDPIVSAVQGDSHKNAEVRRSLQPLVDMAAETGCAVYGVTHFTKGTSGRDPVERVTGSLAFGALVRVITVAMKLPDEGGHPPGARLFMRAKSNIGPDGGGFHYFLDEADIPGHPGLRNTRVLWGAAVDGTARELLAKAETLGDGQGVAKEAAAWLRGLLSGGPIPAAEVYAEGKKNGFSKMAAWRAKAALGAESTKMGFAEGWGWRLPDKTEKPSEDFTKVSIQPGVKSSGENNTQHIDSVEDFTKVSNPEILAPSETFAKPRRFHGLKPSQGASTGGAFGGVEPPKISHPTVLVPSRAAEIFKGQPECQLADTIEL